MKAQLVAGTGTIPLRPVDEDDSASEVGRRGVMKSVRCCVSLCVDGTEVK